MKTDEILLKRKTKVNPDIVKLIRKARHNGLSFAEIARKFNISRSYAYYLCLEGKPLTKYRERMAVYSKEYYGLNREQIIENLIKNQKRYRQQKAMILEKARKKTCYTGRSKMT